MSLMLMSWTRPLCYGLQRVCACLQSRSTLNTALVSVSSVATGSLLGMDLRLSWCETRGPPVQDEMAPKLALLREACTRLKLSRDRAETLVMLVEGATVPQVIDALQKYTENFEAVRSARRRHATCRYIFAGRPPSLSVAPGWSSICVGA